ncbi:MAG: hypothetical protein CME70_20840 [Halobacteriovorax sp.]|nr:hypothetical protein [Halobacteriovorax sp.]|tara:strand:- start:14449 stop:15648 length:1200 start_codon:yes stop_codon:yes gene_type:complete
MKAFGLDMKQIQNGAAQGVNSSAGKTLFGNQVGVAEAGEFANLMDILGGANKTKSPDLLEVLKAAKENPDALTQLPKDVLSFISQEFRFDGSTILNDAGKPIQVDDILSKIKELKPELLGQKTGEAVVNNDAKAMEVRNLLKSHELGFDNASSKSQTLFPSGDDFVQTKNSVQKAGMTNEAIVPKKMNGLNQYSKESKNLDSNIISQTATLEIPEAAVGMAQLKSDGAEMSFSQMGAQEKVVNLSNVNSTDSNNLINEISRLIEKNNIKSADNMEVTVKHDELGQFKIEASKNADTNQLDLKIISKDKIGHNFFVENESQLAKTLNQSGIKLGNFKIALSSENAFTANAESGGKEFSEGFSGQKGQQGQFGQRQGENSDSQRRRHLWQAFKENAEYASA